MVEHFGPNQRVIEDEICLLEHPEGAQSQKVSGARTSPNKPDLPGQPLGLRAGAPWPPY